MMQWEFPFDDLDFLAHDVLSLRAFQSFFPKSQACLPACLLACTTSSLPLSGTLFSRQTQGWMIGNYNFVQQGLANRYVYVDGVCRWRSQNVESHQVANLRYPHAVRTPLGFISTACVQEFSSGMRVAAGPFRLVCEFRSHSQASCLRSFV